MAPKKVIPADRHPHFADYAEFQVIDDAERFAMTQPRPGVYHSWMNVFLLVLGGAACWAGIWVVREILRSWGWIQ